MAEDGFKTTIIALVFFTLFTWLLLTVVSDFGAEYGMDASNLGNGSYDISEYQTSVGSVQGNVSSYRTSFESGKVDDIDDASGMFATAKKFINIITTPFTLLGDILEQILGFPSGVVDFILGILGIGLILGIWRVLRSGS